MHRLINALLVLAAGLVIGAATVLVIHPDPTKEQPVTATAPASTAPAAEAENVPGACLAALVEADDTIDAAGTLIEQLSRGARTDVVDAQIAAVREHVSPYTEARDTCRGLR